LAWPTADTPEAFVFCPWLNVKVNTLPLMPENFTSTPSFFVFFRNYHHWLRPEFFHFQLSVQALRIQESAIQTILTLAIKKKLTN
jgi:hypothetical protein